MLSNTIHNEIYIFETVYSVINEFSLQKWTVLPQLSLSLYTIISLAT